MRNDATHPLRDALGGLGVPPPNPAEVIPPAEWTTGVVTAVQIVTAPYTVTLRLPDGTTTDPLPFLGWWAPKVNDVTWLVRQGPALYVLGAIAPTNLYVPPAPIIPPAPPPPPVAPPSIITRTVTPTDRAYWSSYGWKTDELIQGGPHNRAFWFYGGGIAAAKGAGTIIKGSIYVKRRTDAHGVNGAARVRLGTHVYGTRPGSGTVAHSNVAVAANLLRGKALSVPLTAAHIASLNAGAAGLGLEPGASGYSSPDYIKVEAGGASGQLVLTIQT